MKNYLFILICSLITLAFTVSATWKKDIPKIKETGTLSLHFENVVNDQALRLDDANSHYKNAYGDDFKVTVFKYYISNISLIDENGKPFAIPDSYLLINAADSASLKQELANIPVGNYSGISFTIGVDSIRNFAGAQSGALDPAKGMFWSWDSGYIFVKLEGESSKSASKRKNLTFHIGGAKYPNNTIRTFTQKFDKTLRVENGKLPELGLTVNAAALFEGKTTIDFSKLSFTMGGPNSVIVADNYANGMFRVTSIKN